MRIPLFYKNVPQFGFDIGTKTIKIVQLRRAGGSIEVQAYGYCHFPPEAIAEGIIVDPEAIAKELKPFLQKLPYGKLTAKRVIAGLPATKLFTRTLKLPQMNPADLNQAVQYEVEQYVPVPINDLYTDYEIVNTTSGAEPQVDVLMIAAPRAIVDSYVKLFDALGFSIGAVEGNMTAVVRALLHSGDAGSGTLVMDIGSVSSDITIYDKFIPLTGSSPEGGEQYTTSLMRDMNVQRDQANEIKMKFGIAKSGMQQKVLASLMPHLQATVKEAKRVIKFYESRSDEDHKVASVVISGGSAAMPGFAEYLRKEIGLPLTVADPWKKLELKDHAAEDMPLYATAIGLALRGLL